MAKKCIKQQCPKCKSFNIIDDDDAEFGYQCINCGNIFIIEVIDYKALKEKEIKHKQKIREKKRKAKEKLILRYKSLKKMINKSYKIKDVNRKHDSFHDIDEEFSDLCPKKYKSYTTLGIFQEHLRNEYYFCYLNNRLTKMIKDIDRILFYFDK